MVQEIRWYTLLATLKDFKERVGAIVTGEGRHPDRRPAAAYMSGHAKAVMVRALEEVRRSGRERIGTEHLLLRILTEDKGEVTAVLQRNNVRLAELRLAEERLNGTASVDLKKMKWYHTKHYASALSAAEEYSRLLGCQTIEPEHLLYGVLQSESAEAVRILRGLGVNRQDLLATL